MTFNFDMDGTFVDLYGVSNWLDYLDNEDTTPYEVAKPFFSMSLFARYLNRLQKQGHEINIVSWCSKNGSTDFNQRVVEAKKKWLKQHLPSVHFDNVYIVPYGTPKHQVVKSGGFLFDDEFNNCRGWNNCYGSLSACYILIPQYVLYCLREELTK